MSLLTDLQAYWKLDETSGTRVDSFSTNDLADNNTVTSNPGIQGNAAQFTAANQEWLSISDNVALSAGDVDFTIACWAYLDSKGTLRGIVSKGDWNTGAGREYLLEYNVNVDRFRFSVRNSTDAATAFVNASSLGSPSLATWYFIVAWHDATADTINIQVNGGAVDSTSHSGGVNDSTQNFVIGSYQPVPGGFVWDGRIDEVGFWRRILTSIERVDLYNGGVGTTIESFSTTQSINSNTSIQGTSVQTIDANSTVLSAQPIQTIDSDTNVAATVQQTIQSDTNVKATVEQTIGADSTILEGQFAQAINSDSEIFGIEVTQTISSNTNIAVEVQQTIQSNSAVKKVGIVQVIGANTSLFLQVAQSIQSNSVVLIREVDLKLFKESNLVNEVGVLSNPLDFGTVEAGEDEPHPDNPFVLFNDKGGSLGSVDARSVKVSVVQLALVDELVGTSSGSPSQTFTVAFPPTVDDAELVTVKVNNIAWTRVSSFAGFNTSDEIYTFDAVTGAVTFGDGFQGKIPPIGNSVKVSYTPDTILFGREPAEQLWVGVQSNGVISNSVNVALEELTPSDTTHVTTLHTPITGVNGVFLKSDPNKLGTNFFTGGGFISTTGVITLGTALPDLNNVWVDYDYTIEDDLEASFTQIGRTVSHTFANPIPSNNAKRMNFRVLIPSTASPSGIDTIRFTLRFEYVE